jgi:hypothetical protein
VGQVSREEPGGLAPEEGPLLVPPEGAGRGADAPVVKGQAEQRREREDGGRKLGRLFAALTSQMREVSAHAGARVHQSSLGRLALVDL